MFGRGIGECIVAHLGAGCWIIVDSHRMAGPSTEPVALAYLDSIAIDPSQVEVVAATHWDKDHIAGLSTVVDACDNAAFWCTGAVNVPEFIRDLARDAAQGGPLGTGAKEFLAVVELVLARGAGVTWANRTSSIKLGHGLLAALAPSEFTQTAALLHQTPGPACNITEPTPNESSLVLWFETKDTAILLGGDLEVGVGNTGWANVVAQFTPPPRASMYKVAHHGSPDADHADIWERLLLPRPEAVVAPFSSAKRPRDEDVERLRAASNAHFTGPRGGGRIRREKHVERMAAAATLSGVRRRAGAVGHVRLRRELSCSDWTVAYGPEAGPL